MLIGETSYRIITNSLDRVIIPVVISMVSALMFGLFDKEINNDKIFEAITPAFQTIIGGFIGLITGIKIGQDSKE